MVEPLGEQGGGWLQNQKESYRLIHKYHCWAQVLRKPGLETKLGGAEFIAPPFTKSRIPEQPSVHQQMTKSRIPEQPSVRQQMTKSRILEQPSVHQQMNGYRRCGTCVRWNTTQP